jgi:exopolysaccharide biosynthesis polyprenyl glycosylphosphotransferase
MDGVKLRTLAWELEKTGTDLCLAPALLDVAGPRTTVRPAAGLTLLHVEHPQLSGPRQVFKDLFDRTAAVLALMGLAPVMLGIAVAIKLSDGGPALFTQERVGKDGQRFRIYKFRTMVVDAEARLAEIRQRNEFDGVLFKIRKDPRITVIGARLRKWSLDELPQLINVLRGEMSLVGPRPALPEEAAEYAVHVRRRLVVKPGITGMWQVNGRSDLSWEETVRLDLRYVENWSFALDLQILWKTFSVIFRGAGAY